MRALLGPAACIGCHAQLVWDGTAWRERYNGRVHACPAGPHRASGRRHARRRHDLLWALAGAAGLLMAAAAALLLLATGPR